MYKADQFQVAGVTEGTPALITPDGKQFPMSVKELSSLGINICNAMFPEPRGKVVENKKAES